MVDEPRAALPSGDWPLAGWLAGRRILAGNIAARLLWQPALSSGHAGLAMLRPALRAFVPAIPVARLFEPVAGPLQRQETSWSEVDRFWWRRQAPELALLRRHRRWQITPVPVQREQAASAPAAGPPSQGLVREAPLDEVVALELGEEGPVGSTLAHPAEQAVSTGAPAVGQQSQVPASRAGPLAAIGRAFSTVMRRLFPIMEHAPVAGSPRYQTLPEAASAAGQRELPAAPGADAGSPQQPVPEAGLVQASTLGGQGVAGQAPAGAIAQHDAPAGLALSAPPAGPAASPATVTEPPEPAPAPEGEETPAALASAGAFRSSTGTGEEPAGTQDLPSEVSGEPTSAAGQTAGAPSVARRAVLAGHSPPGVQRTIDPATLPAPSLEGEQPAPRRGMALLRLRALELWHRVVPRRARPAGEAALRVERAVEPATSAAGRADQGGVEGAGYPIEPAPAVQEQAAPEALAVSATTPTTGLPPIAPVMPEAQPGAITGMPAPGDGGGTVEPPASLGEVERSAEAPVSSSPPDLPEPQDHQRVSGALAALQETPGPAFQPWRPGEPRPAPADLIAPLAAGVLQRRGAEASAEAGPAATGPEEGALPAAGAPGFWGSAGGPPAAPSGPVVPGPGGRPASGAASQELPSWAASLSEQLRRLQRSAQAEPETAIQQVARLGTRPSPRQARAQPAPAGPQQGPRTGSAGAPAPTTQAPAAAGLPSSTLSAPSEPAAGASALPAEPAQRAPLQRSGEPSPSVRSASVRQGQAITPGGPGPAAQAPTAVGESASPELGSPVAAGTGTSSTPVQLVTFPPLAEQLFARNQTFGVRILQRSLLTPLANAAGWAKEHAAAAGGLAAEVVSQVSSFPAPGSVLLSGPGETAGAQMAPGETPRAPRTSEAAPSPEPAGGVPAESGAGAGLVSPYAAYLEAVRASGMLPGAPGRSPSEAQSGRSAAGPFRLSEGGSEPAAERGLARPGALGGIHHAAGHTPFETSGAAMDVQRNAVGAAAGTQEPEPLPTDSAPDQDGLAQVLRRLPPAMAAAALAKGVLAPQPGVLSRAAGSAVETILPWQPLAQVQAPAVVARAPDFAAAGVEEIEVPQPFAGDWEVFGRGSPATWEASAELPHTLQRAAEPQPLEASGAPSTAGEQGQVAPGSPQAAELDRLADEVFELLRWRLAAERERMMR